jgi:hypothetical protein
MTAPPRRDTGLPWAGRAAGFLVGGTVGAVLVRGGLSHLGGTESPLLPFLLGTAVAVPAVGLPLWWVALGPSRHGPWWGGLLAAWIPAGLVAALAVVSAALGDLSGREVLGATALLYLASAPLTVVLAAVGALLETWLPRSG